MDDASNAFAKMVPGFDFLQGLVKNAGAAMPSAGPWVAPTLDPQELEKRIDELRTVQFWLEQNARMLGATIQAMEVQKMTLSALKSMNVSFTDLTESLKMRLPEAPAAGAPEAPAAATAPAASAPAAATVDPLKWWGALTQQFTELAASALQDGAAAASAAASAATNAASSAAGSAGQPDAAAAPAAQPGAGANPAPAAPPPSNRRAATKR